MNQRSRALMLTAALIAGCSPIFYTITKTDASFHTDNEHDDLPPLRTHPSGRVESKTGHDSTPPQFARSQLQNSPLSPNDSFGACLMMKEDNDLLYEWIAFHYIKLPLRYLFVGSDTGNMQDPRRVLDRWNDTDLTYWVIDDTQFINRHGPMPSWKPDENPSHHAFVHRQRGFITVCSEFMKAQNISWVIYQDSDEFIVPNYLSDDEDEARNAAEASNSTDAIAYAMRAQLIGTKTILEAIRRVNQIQGIKPCLTMPRVLIGSLENASCPGANEVMHLAKREFDFQQMSTLRFTQRALKGDFSTGKFGKVFVDLSRIHNITVPPKNIHRPFKPACEYPAPVFLTSLFYINHYVGSWERYSSRLDGRRSCKEWESRAYLNNGNSCEQHIHEWLPTFIKVMGIKKAKYLLGVDEDGERAKPSKPVMTCPLQTSTR